MSNTYQGKIVIIGAAAAGISAAENIRKVNTDAEIQIITEEQHMPYYRPLLTEYIGDASVEEKPMFHLKKSDWFKEKNIQITRNEKVTTIKSKEKKIVTSKNNEISYDKVICATGSTPFVPMPGALEKQNVFALRTFDDAKKIHEYAAQSKNIVVIGGGLLGLEAVNALLKKDCNLTVIELADRILPMQLDETGSAMLQKIIEDKGVTLKLGKMTDSFTVEEKDNGEKVTAVKLKSGETIDADMVLFSIGVRANTTLFDDNCPAEKNKGVIVNEHMQTTVPDVYACGDVAEFGRGVPLWMPAIKMGKVAGLNAIGEESTFVPQGYPATLNSFGTHVYSVGDICRDKDTENYTTMQFIDHKDNVYRKLYLKEDKLVGGILIADMKKAMKLSKAIEQGISYQEAAELLK